MRRCWYLCLHLIFVVPGSLQDTEWSGLSIAIETFANASLLPLLTQSAGELNSLREGLTFWLKRGAPPRCLIEQMVAAVVAVDSRSGVDMSEIEGMEFWTHEGGFQAVHYDFDEFYYERPRPGPDGLWPTPRFSSVTFLAPGAGAPTVILKQRQGRGGDVPHVPVEAILVAPSANKHIRFDGALAHGVLGREGELDLDGLQELGRTTLLVNYWPTTPRGWDGGLAPLPEELVSAFPLVEDLSPSSADQSGSRGAGTGLLAKLKEGPASSFEEVVYHRYILPRGLEDPHQEGRWLARMPRSCPHQCHFVFPEPPSWMGLVAEDESPEL